MLLLISTGSEGQVCIWINSGIILESILLTMVFFFFFSFFLCHVNMLIKQNGKNFVLLELLCPKLQLSRLAFIPGGKQWQALIHIALNLWVMWIYDQQHTILGSTQPSPPLNPHYKKRPCVKSSLVRGMEKYPVSRV